MLCINTRLYWTHRSYRCNGCNGRNGCDGRDRSRAGSAIDYVLFDAHASGSKQRGNRV